MKILRHKQVGFFLKAEFKAELSHLILILSTSTEINHIYEECNPLRTPWQLNRHWLVIILVYSPD